MPLSASTVRANYERVREEVGPGVTVVAATKYVPTDELAALVEAGVEVVGENRLQDLLAKRDRFGEAFRWHFIGHLQSRKARDVSGLCELCHSLESLSAARRLTIPALVEVNLGGEETKSGVAPDELPGFLAEVQELGVDVSGLMTMPPLADDPEASRPYFRRLRELAAEHGLEQLSMGTSQDYRIAAEEGATWSASAPCCTGVESVGVMGLGDVWSRALVYFGIVEEDEYWDEEAYAAEEELERTYDRDRQNVRRLNPRSSQRREGFDDWSEPAEGAAQTAVAGSPGGRRLEAVSGAAARVHLVVPRSFNDAQSIADKFKDSTPVIVNLQSADPELSKRLIDFSSGLTYALSGSMQRVADKVFLLTPRNVEVSAEERARLIDRGFFNQA